MYQGKTKSGFEYKIDPKAFDDYELLEDIYKVEVEGSQGHMVSVVNRLLGDKQKRDLMEHLRDKNGRVGMTAMFEAVMEIFSNHQEGKN